MTQFEFYKSFQFVLELLVAETLYIYRFRRRSHFPLRLIFGIGGCFLFAWLFPIIPNNAFYCSFMFLSIFLFTILMIKFVFKESWLTVFFCCLAGYTTQHLTYEIYNIMITLMNVSGDTPMGFYGSEFVGMFSNPFLAAVYFCIYILSYFACFLFFGDKLKKNEVVHLKGVFIFIFTVFILIIDIFLNAIVVFYGSGGGFQLYIIVVGVYNILCCIIALYLQFEVALRQQLETTLDTVQHIWHQVKEQYAISKENIEIINLKCHDLKHQIHAIQKNETVSSSVLKDLENHISIYDSTVKTGNDALDVILTEKSLTCNKNGIKLSCITDGEKLNFMAEEDIYALFGNIIDNAIEAVLQVEESKRTISISVKAIDNMLTIRQNNYYAKKFSFNNGIPQTTKEDKIFHGFGLKSIKYICEQYGGDLCIKAGDNIYSLSILFFLKDIAK